MAEMTVEDQKAEEFAFVTKILEDSRADLERAVAGLDDELCSANPAVSAWSITQVIEHLAIIEKRVLLLLQTKLPEQESVSDASAAQKNDAELVNQVRSRATRINAPGVTQPSGQYPSCHDALAAFNASRQRTLAYAVSTPPYLRGRLLPHPVLGPIDGCQWLLALGAHTQRHVRQIEEIRAALVQ